MNYMGIDHTGFNVHSRVRAESKEEAERIGKYMIRPMLPLNILSPSHIPDKG
jgi:hypothetical protein